MRSGPDSISMTDRKNGRFRKFLRCFEGKEVIDWLVEHVPECSIRSIAHRLAQRLLDSRVIVPVVGSQHSDVLPAEVHDTLRFVDGPYALYRFQVRGNHAVRSLIACS